MTHSNLWGSARLFSLPFLVAAFFSFMYQETPAQGRTGRDPRPRPADARQAPSDIAYTISMSKPATHLLEVEMRLKWPQMPDQAELKMPVWTPGSYLVREYGRHVQDFTVKNTAGAQLGWRKVNKNTWQVDSKGTSELI